jgi:AbrB family looped-hinge helix DNA binding protein
MEASMGSAITVKGQATIPKAIRDHLQLKPGDHVKFFVHPDGTVVLLPKLPVSALRGIVKSRRRASVEEMNEAVATGAAAGFKRRLSGWIPMFLSAISPRTIPSSHPGPRLLSSGD